MNVSLDDRTAQKMLWLSEGGAKVSRMSEEVCPVLDRPERYEHSPQVRKCPYQATFKAVLVFEIQRHLVVRL